MTKDRLRNNFNPNQFPKDTKTSIKKAQDHYPSKLYVIHTNNPPRPKTSSKKHKLDKTTLSSYAKEFELNPIKNSYQVLLTTNYKAIANPSKPYLPFMLIYSDQSMDSPKTS